MSTPNHRRHFGRPRLNGERIKVSSGGRELLSGIDSGTTLSLGGLAFLEQKLYRNFRIFCGIEMPCDL